jgi:hypothetical protein
LRVRTALDDGRKGKFFVGSVGSPDGQKRACGDHEGSGVKVSWIHSLGPGAASYRYRAQMPAEQVERITGHKCSLNAGAADVVVFAKPMPDDLQTIRMVKNDGARVVVDFCDDHFDHPTLYAVYRDMAKQADIITCPTGASDSRASGPRWTFMLRLVIGCSKKAL